MCEMKWKWEATFCSKVCFQEVQEMLSNSAIWWPGEVILTLDNDNKKENEYTEGITNQKDW